MNYYGFMKWYKTRPKHLLTFKDEWVLFKSIIYANYKHHTDYGRSIYWWRYDVAHGITENIISRVEELLTVSMTYEEFVDWCNMSACEGLWNKSGAWLCITAMDRINKISKSKKRREIEWRRYELEHHLIENVVKPTNDRFIKKLEKALNSRGFKTLGDKE